MSLDSSSTAMLGAALVGVIAVIALLRRLAVPRLTLWLCLAGAAAWALAAGEPRWHRPRQGDVTVLVDLSPSTRIADYRDRRRLNARIGELLGQVKYHLEFFADGAVENADSADTLADSPCERTTLPPLSGDAAVLLSDCRFALPAAGPPTYVVVDPALDDPGDAAIEQLALRGGQITVTVHNAGKPRELTLEGTSRSVPSGNHLLTEPLPANSSSITAELSAGDAWPENDALSAAPLPPATSERWWVGSPPAGGDWRTISPESLPTDPAAYLSPTVIVLQNIPAADLDQSRRQLLRQYVEELGGGIVIVGGDRAFGAGKYLGTDLEAIAPLASVPPKPTMRWMLLADGSGSMAEGGHWGIAAEAMTNLLPQLPPDDLADIGSFSDVLTWWSSGKTVRDTARLALPPTNVAPHGPTNLEPVLLQIARSSDGATLTHLLLISDADVQIDKPAALTDLLWKKKIHLHVLAIGEGSGLATLRQIAAGTGGSVLRQLDPRQWANGAADLLTAEIPSSMEKRPIMIRFENELSALPARMVKQWNRTWLKASAGELAFDTDGAQRVPLAARWQVGQGRVSAVALAADSAEIEALAKLTAREPRDPRFAVTWQTGRLLQVRVDGLDGTHYLNDQAVTLRLANGTQTPVPQVGPGRYELALPAPRLPTFAAVAVAGHVVDRLAVAGRYAPEFDTIGNDHAAMEKLAQLTVGRVVTPAEKGALEFNWPARDVLLTSWFAALGALLCASGLAVWRLR